MNSDTPDALGALVAAHEAGREYVIVTIVRASGSTPRTVGAKMLVFADGSTAGTVGGGVRESEIIDAACRTLESGAPRLMPVDFYEGLKTGKGPVCGGKAEVFFEPIAPRRKALIAGAGHIGFALARILDTAGFDVMVLDPRKEWASNSRFPDVHVLSQPWDDDLSGLGLGPRDVAVLVGPGADADKEVLNQVIDMPLRYIGMIGSEKRVRAVFESVRKRRADSEIDFSRVHAPIGLDIGAQTPGEIAVSISSEIISVFSDKV